MAYQYDAKQNRLRRARTSLLGEVDRAMAFLLRLLDHRRELDEEVVIAQVVSRHDREVCRSTSAMLCARTFSNEHGRQPRESQNIDARDQAFRGAKWKLSVRDLRSKQLCDNESQRLSRPEAAQDSS